MHIHPCFKLNGISFNNESLQDKANELILKGEDHEKHIGTFLKQWLNDEDEVCVNTSGSTGTPKSIQLSKQAMIASAEATGAYFKLEAESKALLCLPATYIAGKMMLVRALVLGWHLDYITPKSVLNIPSKTYDFSAMVPMQLQQSSHHIHTIKTLIVGGAKVSNVLREQLQHLKTRVFETYGMTETITHIAVKPINNPEQASCFKTLPNITISQDDRDCLVIQAPRLSKKAIITNDVVQLHDSKTFEWLGRYDNVINSGGVKLFPEQIEQKLQHLIKARFFIASEADEVLGERVILVIETSNFSLDLNKEVFFCLTSIEKPKKVYNISKFIETSSGKVKRLETLHSVKK